MLREASVSRKGVCAREGMSQAEGWEQPSVLPWGCVGPVEGQEGSCGWSRGSQGKGGKR